MVVFPSAQAGAPTSTPTPPPAKSAVNPPSATTSIPTVQAAAARKPWKELFERCKSERWGTPEIRKRRYMNMEYTRGDGFVADAARAVAIPERQWAVVVRGPREGDPIIATAACVSAAEVLPRGPAWMPPSQLERCISNLREHMLAERANGRLEQLLVAWLHAMRATPVPS